LFAPTRPAGLSRAERFRSLQRWGLPIRAHWEGGRHMGASILIGILITFLVVILVLYLVQRLPLDARARQIAQIIVIIIGIISLLKYLAVF
jgi:type II secretory pathway component PulM